MGEQEGNAMEITRRHMLCAGAGGLAIAHSPRAFAGWEQSDRYPDPAIQVLDPSFAKYRLNNAGIERLAAGMRWGEGPVWFGDGRYLLWSDSPNDRIMRWDEETGAVGVFRKPSNKSNGLTRDRQGRLLTCEHTGRRVTRTEYDGTVTVLIDRFEGKRLNSPNDIVVRSDDSIWFTDPMYGITSNYSGSIDAQELPTNVYRLDKSGRATVVAGDVNRPDGLAFSPDETKLYVIEDGVSPQVFRVYDVVDDGTKLANGRTFITVERGGIADGLRLDVDGNLWCGWGGGAGNDGVMIFNSAGSPIGRIDLPERCANLCFGGYRRSRLFMAASHALYSLFVRTQGAPYA
jgi:gluconolactonase